MVKCPPKKEGGMSQKDIIVLSQKELRRLKIIQEVINKHITQRKASELLGLSQRQIIRIVKRVRLEGDKGVIHKSRGKPSKRKMPDIIKNRVINLYKKKYPDFGPTLASEKLLELNKINLSRETLRKWLIEKGFWLRKRKSRKHRYWRQRCECFGQMVQLDGSHHKWLEERGPELVLMTYVDDATNKVFARFYDYEGTLPAMDSFKRYIEKYGIPQSIYVDKHTTYRSTKKQSIEEQLENKQPQSQFERALNELDVNVIHANSPQAKGRVERILRTFQDRLIKEMRLRNINTKEQANKFLEEYLAKFNERFSIEPSNPTNLHRPISKDIDLDKILSIRTKRALRNDLTVRHNKKLYQILDMPEGARTKYVFVEERLNGKLYINYNGFTLKYKLIDTKPLKPKSPYKPRKTYIPPPDHPWRKFKLPGSLNFEEKEELEVCAL
jgi:transposase/nicotinamide riboside kinase